LFPVGSGGFPQDSDIPVSQNALEISCDLQSARARLQVVSNLRKFERNTTAQSLVCFLQNETAGGDSYPSKPKTKPQITMNSAFPIKRNQGSTPRAGRSKKSVPSTDIDASTAVAAPPPQPTTGNGGLLRSKSQTTGGRSVEVNSTGTAGLRPTEFRLNAPSARTVNLAAEFTEWETAAIPLARSDDGTWRISLPLAPGRYAYRFLVDGNWRDDPHCSERVPNPFGTANSVIVVL
jgi:hypothetical protein